MSQLLPWPNSSRKWIQRKTLQMLTVIALTFPLLIFYHDAPAYFLEGTQSCVLRCWLISVSSIANIPIQICLSCLPLKFWLWVNVHENAYFYVEGLQIEQRIPSTNLKVSEQSDCTFFRDSIQRLRWSTFLESFRNYLWYSSTIPLQQFRRVFGRDYLVPLFRNVIMRNLTPSCGWAWLGKH